MHVRSFKGPSRDSVLEGPAQFVGGNTPTSVPHTCPYKLNGASEEDCEGLTTNYRRNLDGCCGTHDSRAFAPCNAHLRRCVKCLEEGKGVGAELMVDVLLGLCAAHGGKESSSSNPEIPVETVVPPLAQIKPTRQSSMPPILRTVKVAALKEARASFEGDYGTLGTLVNKAIEILKDKRIAVNTNSLYTFASNGLEDAERTDIGLKEKRQKTPRKGRRW